MGWWYQADITAYTDSRATANSIRDALGDAGLGETSGYVSQTAAGQWEAVIALSGSKVTYDEIEAHLSRLYETTGAIFHLTYLSEYDDDGPERTVIGPKDAIYPALMNLAVNEVMSGLERLERLAEAYPNAPNTDQWLTVAAKMQALVNWIRAAS